MKTEEIEVAFRDQPKALVRIVADFVRAFAGPKLEPVQSRRRDGSPGDTVKFVLAPAKSALFSLQFYPAGFVQMKWSRTTLRKVGIELKARDVLRREVGPLCSGSHLDEETPTEFRVVIRTGDASRVHAIIGLVRPIVEAAIGGSGV